MRRVSRTPPDAFDRQESAKLYAIATRVAGVDYLIEEAVAVYVSERCPQLKHGRGYAMELQELMPFYVGRPLSALSDVCKAIRLRVTNTDKDAAEGIGQAQRMGGHSTQTQTSDYVRHKQAIRTGATK